MARKSIRFAVWNGEDLRAATWKLWNDSKHSDLYLACRALGGKLKASMHQSGKWHVAFTDVAFREEVEGAIPTLKSRFVDQWSRPKPFAEGVTMAFRIVTPFASVSSKIGPRDKNIIWIPNAPATKATEIDILISSSGTQISGWPGKRSMGTSFLGSFTLANGESVWAVYWTIPMPNLMAPTGNPRFFKGKTTKHISDDFRALAFGVEPDGSKVMYDLALVKKADSLWTLRGA